MSAVWMELTDHNDEKMLMNLELAESVVSLRAPYRGTLTCVNFPGVDTGVYVKEPYGEIKERLFRK